MRALRLLDTVVIAALCVLVPDQSASAQAQQPFNLLSNMSWYAAPAKSAKTVVRAALQQVAGDDIYPEGTIVIEQSKHRLSLMLKGGETIRYPIAVGREGAQWKGVAVIAAKRENPDWYPPADMLARRPNLPLHVAGGRPDNPLGERAIYLKDAVTLKDRFYRIHGTIEPEKIGQNVSSGCIRMYNEHVKDLYERIQIGTRVIVLP